MLLCDIFCFLQRVHLDIQAGEHAQDYQQVAAKDKLNELQLRIRQLLDQVEQITKEQNYQRVRLFYSLTNDFCFLSIVKNVFDKHLNRQMHVYYGGRLHRLWY